MIEKIYIFSEPPRKNFRYYDMIMVAFVTLLLCANLVGAAKIVDIGGFTFGGTLIFFPLTYLFGDILTEVYGYKRSRRVVWSGFGSLGFAALVCWAIVALPPAEGWDKQQAVEDVFGNTPRLALSSLLAYFAGEFANSYSLAKMKIVTKGRALWARLIGSTVIGEAVDTLILYPLAFYGLWPTHILIKVMISSYIVKVLWEVVATPVTYRVVSYLKKVEDEDYYDYNTDFSPFSLRL